MKNLPSIHVKWRASGASSPKELEAHSHSSKSYLSHVDPPLQNLTLKCLDQPLIYQAGIV